MDITTLYLISGRKQLVIVIECTLDDSDVKYIFWDMKYCIFILLILSNTKKCAGLCTEETTVTTTDTSTEALKINNQKFDVFKVSQEDNVCEGLIRFRMKNCPTCQVGFRKLDK